jgi:SAM-dependent methyltransferase
VNVTTAAKTVVPAPLRARLRRIAGIAELNARIDELEERLAESREETWMRSRSRWRDADPTPDLTWDEAISGDMFIAKVRSHAAFGPDTDILEIGPGYGRLLQACLDADAEFRSYLGVDLSAKNVEHLTDRFGSEKISFINEDIETVKLARDVDLVFSSLTLKHLYPSFEKALANVARSVRPGGRFVFDLIEGERRYWEHDRATYIRTYSRDEVREILTRIGLTDIAFAEVQHTPDRVRLLVVATRP